MSRHKRKSVGLSRRGALIATALAVVIFLMFPPLIQHGIECFGVLFLLRMVAPFRTIIRTTLIVSMLVIGIILVKAHCY
ncbi:MAG TPA: hypothetical protein VG621_01220 [Candidatus Paceibacterota bacterium]|nr:hypothetical protein [Candidatus Paceibacterota bacterium]